MSPDLEPDPDDDALMAATARGDAAAFRVLVERWSPRVLAFTTRALARRADAEDVTQETFVRALRAAPRYLPQGRFAAWLFRIAGNLTRAELRRRRVRGWLLGWADIDPDTILASLPAPRYFDADGPLHAAETRQVLALGLARLPERQRLAVLLHHLEGLPVRDVAVALDTSEHAAESLLARGMAALRRSLARPRR
jgi:RNA polymerase sigma-70 factor (ECF subfamily)